MCFEKTVPEQKKALVHPTSALATHGTFLQDLDGSARFFLRKTPPGEEPACSPLGLQIAQSRPYVYALDPKVGVYMYGMHNIYIHIYIYIYI